MEHLNNVVHATSELFELAKDEHFWEVEAPVAVGGVEASLGAVERLLVLVVQPEATVHTVDDNGRRQRPDCLLAGVRDERLARRYHLIGYLK